MSNGWFITVTDINWTADIKIIRPYCTSNCIGDFQLSSSTSESSTSGSGTYRYKRHSWKKG